MYLWGFDLAEGLACALSDGLKACHCLHVAPAGPPKLPSAAPSPPPTQSAALLEDAHFGENLLINESCKYRLEWVWYCIDVHSPASISWD